uniref:Putative trypsin-like serine protease n=1 Tax=Xenopsylla cheopis TaxID=163159 RepID=A0A6M2E2W6_XENCH
MSFIIILIFLALMLQQAKCDTKIVGGQIAKEGDFLFTVSLRIRGHHICGGSLIKNDTVLTAAHCIIRGVDLSEYSVAFGIHSLHNITTKNIMNVTKIIKHENYLDGKVGDDIAVVKVKRLNQSEPITTIKLNKLHVKDNTMCTVIGWGDTYEGSQNGSRCLRYVNIPIVPMLNCSKAYGVLFHNDMICAGEYEKDSCQGDSGGPLVYNNTLVGIVSFGKGCGNIYPGVYTNVSHYSSWIKQNHAYVNRQSLGLILLLLVMIELVTQV